MGDYSAPIYPVIIPKPSLNFRARSCVKIQNRMKTKENGRGRYINEEKNLGWLWYLIWLIPQKQFLLELMSRSPLMVTSTLVNKLVPMPACRRTWNSLWIFLKGYVKISLERSRAKTFFQIYSGASSWVPSLHVYQKSVRPVTENNCWSCTNAKWRNRSVWTTSPSCLSGSRGRTSDSFRCLPSPISLTVEVVTITLSQRQALSCLKGAFIRRRHDEVRSRHRRNGVMSQLKELLLRCQAKFYHLAPTLQMIPD